MDAEIVFVLNIWQQLWDGLNVLTNWMVQDGTAFAQHLPIFIAQPLLIVPRHTTIQVQAVEALACPKLIFRPKPALVFQLVQ